MVQALQFMQGDLFIFYLREFNANRRWPSWQDDWIEWSGL